MKRGCGTNGGQRHEGVLRRLARDTRGNALMLMAAMTVPLLAFSGSALDMARLYVVKVRLQHACDAGVLAGRKAMTDFKKDSTTLETKASDQAQMFFNNNFVKTWMQTSDLQFSATKQALGTDYANAVVGQASVKVPMKIMYVFGFQPKTVSVTCQAQSDMADADTVFVLDMSGSMACVPGTNCSYNIQDITYQDGTTGYYYQEQTGSKLEQVRQAVLAYDDAIRNNTDPSTHFRYAFAPYSANVNIGAELYNKNPDLIEQGIWTYQSRTPGVLTDSQTPDDDVHGPDTSVTSNATSVYPVPQADCVAGRSPTGVTTATGYSKAFTYTPPAVPPLPPPSPVRADYAAQARIANPVWSAANGGTCSGTVTINRINWTYGPVKYKVGDFVRSGMVPGAAPPLNPSRADGSKSQKWHGCVEDLDTTSATSFSWDNLPDDLDPEGTGKWRPVWPDVAWERNSSVKQPVADAIITEDKGGWPNFNLRSKETAKNFRYFCGAPAKRLREMTRQQISDYLYGTASNPTEFRPTGFTYHDAGMKWGLKLIWDKGVFADSQPWPNRADPKRYIIFLTDGDLLTDGRAYDEYGMETYDARTTGAPDSSTSTINWRHYARFLAECDAARHANVTVKVVVFATSTNAALNQCDTTGKAKVVKTGKELTDYFTALGTGVAKLRISK